MNLEKKPLVSILIPCFNCEKYIQRCLDTIIQQTYKNLEIVVLNDGSTDESLSIIKNNKKLDSRIKIISQKNMGLAISRNVLIKKSKGEYIFFVDSDDWINLDSIEKFYKIASEKNTDIITSSYYKSKIKKGKLKEKPFYISNKKSKNKNSKQEYLINNSPFAWGLFIKKSFLIDNNFLFNDDYSFFEDAGVISYWIYKTKSFYFFQEPQYHYFFSNFSLSRDFKMTYQKIFDSIQQLNNFYMLLGMEKNNNFPREINDQLAYYHSIVFTYIQFQCKLPSNLKQELKKELKSLEIRKIKYPKRFWKFWYFVLYRAFGY